MKLWEFIETLQTGDEWLCLDTGRRLVMTDRGLRWAGTDARYFRLTPDTLSYDYTQAQMTEVAPHQALRALDNGRRVYVSYGGGPMLELSYNNDGDLSYFGLGADTATISRSATYYVRGAIDLPQET